MVGVVECGGKVQGERSEHPVEFFRGLPQVGILESVIAVDS